MSFFASRDERNGYLLLLCAILLWSTAEVGVRSIRGDISPLQFAFLRFFLGAMILWPLLPWELRKKRLRLTPRILFHAAWLSIFGVFITSITFQYSLMLAGAAVVGTMYGASPIMVLVLSRLILGDPLTPERIAGVLMGFVGLGVLATSEPSATFNIAGFGLCIVNTLSFSFFSVMLKKLGGEFAGLPITVLTMLFGSAFLFVPPLIEGNTLIFETWPRIWPTLLYLGFATTGISYFCFFTGISKVDATRAMSVILLKPPLVAVLAATLLDEPISWNIAVAMVCILGGLYLINIAHRWKRQRVLEEESP